MANVLEKIVLDKRDEINQRKLNFPLDSFIDTLTPSEKDFYAALAAQNTGFIFECKKASPSKGLIRENFDLDEILNAYLPYASCISVLTDEKYFQGTFEYLQYVTRRVSLPVINKDFFIEPYQVYLARYYQADAILLMLSVLDDQTYLELSSIASKLNMAVLTEVSNEEEVHRALNLDARIIGINNRNLRNLTTNLATTEKLVPTIKESGFDGLIISESGIYTHQEVLRLAPLVDGFLVGSALMAQENISNAVKSLVFDDIKVCGVTSLEQAKMIEAQPVSYLGLIRVPTSPRFIMEEDAQQIATHTKTALVGVFQNQDLETIINDVHKFNLSVIQLHGDEDTTYINTLRKTLSEHSINAQIWKAVGVDSQSSLDQISNFSADVDKILLDTKVGNQSGGTGQTFDWRWLDSIEHKDKLVLAGGIDTSNISDARATGVTTLDINSGAESKAGVKDKNKLTQIFETLRNY